jgi:hypothetical protein
MSQSGNNLAWDAVTIMQLFYLDDPFNWVCPPTRFYYPAGNHQMLKFERPELSSRLQIWTTLLVFYRSSVTSITLIVTTCARDACSLT